MWPVISSASLSAAWSESETVRDKDPFLFFWGQNKVWEQETKEQKRETRRPEKKNTNALLAGLTYRRALLSRLDVSVSPVGVVFA